MVKGSVVLGFEGKRSFWLWRGLLWQTNLRLVAEKGSEKIQRQKHCQCGKLEEF